MLLQRCSIRRNGTFIRHDPILRRVSSFYHFRTLIRYIKEHLLLSIASMWVCVCTSATPTITEHVIIRLILHLLLLLFPHQHLLPCLREHLPTPSTRYGHPIALLRWFTVHVVSRIVVGLMVEHHWVELGWSVNLRRLLLRRACSVGWKRPGRGSLRGHLRSRVLIAIVVDLRLL